MSAPQQFATVAAALESFAAGRCKRWVSVDGHQIDLLQAGAPCEVSRPDDQREPVVPSHGSEPLTREHHDHLVAMCIPAELARAAHVLPELAQPEVPAPAPVECCRTCGRPMIGAVP